MANSLTLTSAGKITDLTQPKAVRDRIINSGSVCLIDLTSGYCIDLTSPLAEGQVVKNLVNGAPSATLKNIAGLSAVAGKGLQIGAAAALGRVQVGAGTDYFQTNLNHDYLISAFATYPAADPGGAHIGMLVSKGGTVVNYAQPGPFLAARYADQIAKTAAGTGNGTSTIANAVPSPAGKHQFAFTRVGGVIAHYRDGVSYATNTQNEAGDIVANTNPLLFGCSSVQAAAPGLILHRLYIENLTLSGKSGAGQAAAEYAQNNAKF